MTCVIFLTEEFGAIEIDIESDGAPENAYFRKDDFIAPINYDGSFHDQWGRKFVFHQAQRWSANQNHSLDVWQPKTIGVVRSAQS